MVVWGRPIFRAIVDTLLDERMLAVEYARWCDFSICLNIKKESFSAFFAVNFSLLYFFIYLCSK